MSTRTTEKFAITGAAISVLLTLLASSATGDDTEIYQATYDASTSGRPKVLIAFDDSGSMRGEIDGQRPPYDPNGSYVSSFEPNRIYWTTDGSTPSPGDDQWFSASKNRCAASYQPLDDEGRFTPERARRWVDSTIQQGQCRNECPDNTTYRNPPGPNNAGCYRQQEVTEPVAKLVYRENDSRNRCSNGLIYVDPPGRNNDACYEQVVTDQPQLGWVYRSNDNNNQCQNGWSRLYVDPPGGNNAYDACFEQVEAPESNTSNQWVFISGTVRVCDADIDIPGTWQPLNSQVNNPTHVECRNDQSDNNDDNGTGVDTGFPQNNVLNGNEFGSTADPSVNWGDHAYTFFTSHYLNWFHDDSLIVSRPKIDIAADVIATIVDTNTSIDFGLLEFNRSQGGRITQRIIENMTSTDRDNLIDLVEDMEPAGVTPLCESFWEAYRYLSGLSPEYSDNASYGTTSRGWFHDIATPDNAAISGGNYVSPNTDCAYTYIIIMTDGLPNDDTDANDEIETLTGKTCRTWADEDGNVKNCMPELAEYMATTDLDGDTTNGSQLGITYTIGFDTDQALLEETAELGKGEYYTAENASELTEAFQGALISILSRDTTFTSPAVAVDTFTRTRSRDEVFYAMFKPSDTVDWQGNVKKLKLQVTDLGATLIDANTEAALDPDTGDFRPDAVTFWNTIEDGGSVNKGGVGELLVARDPATRNILINTGENGALQAFNTTNITADSMEVADDSELYSLFGSSSEEAFNKQVAWARGYDAFDVDGDQVVNETRSWIMGDVLHSQPLVINYGALGSNTVDNPQLRLLLGTNHGFVHMFSNDNGSESWAFFPKELASKLPERRRNAVSSDNVYGMDLSPSLYTYDANVDGTIDSTQGDKAWAYLGMRRGGKSYYALDVSSPNSPSLLWHVSSESTDFEELGQTWSEPVITRIPGYNDDNGIPKPVVIIGAGYYEGKDESGVGQPDNEGRGIFIIDAETGALVWGVTPAANSAKNLSESGLVHSVPGKVSVLDSNGDTLTDRIYFGDTGGNLWRVDLGGNSLPTVSQDTWQINKLADLNAATREAPATDRRFFNAPDIVRIRDKGEAIDAVIIGSGDRTNPNAVDVDNYLYMIRDLATAAYTTDKPTTDQCDDDDFYDFRCILPITDAQLFDTTDDLINTAPTVEEQADALAALNNASGWRLELALSGEKSLASTVTLDSTVYAPTYVPANVLTTINQCEPQAGQGLMHIINIYDGSRKTLPLGPAIPDTPSLHFAEDGQIRMLLPPGTPSNSSDQPGQVDCSGGVCDLNSTLRAPYGNYWFQEEF